MRCVLRHGSGGIYHVQNIDVGGFTNATNNSTYGYIYYLGLNPAVRRNTVNIGGNAASTQDDTSTTNPNTLSLMLLCNY